jgi:hypothetical protein
MKMKKEIVVAIFLTTLVNILILVVVFIFIRDDEPEYIIRNESWYMGELKQFARECANKESINYDCLHQKIKDNIPPNYYVHVRSFKDEGGRVGWEFACIDTAKPGHEFKLREALEARQDEWRRIYR